MALDFTDWKVDSGRIILSWEPCVTDCTKCYVKVDYFLKPKDRACIERVARYANFDCLVKGLAYAIGNDT